MNGKMYQALGRIHRIPQRPKLVIVADPMALEKRICERLKQRLTKMEIEDETVMLKSGQIILFGNATTATGHSLHLDKGEISDII
jgi:uncharacterized protein (DUF169 family)